MSNEYTQEAQLLICKHRFTNEHFSPVWYIIHKEDVERNQFLQSPNKQNIRN